MAKKLNKSGRNYSIKVTLEHALVSRLVWAYTREVEEDLKQVKSIKNLDEIIAKSRMLTSVAFHPLYENLSVLEPLMECYLAGSDGKTLETTFNNGDEQLYNLLVEIRMFVKEFPPRLEEFYQNYSSYRQKLLEKSPICKICNKRGANHYFANVKIHNQCLNKVEAKYCEYCANLYLNGEEKCTNKTECEKYQLKDAVASQGSPYGSVSMKIPLEMINKAKREAGEVNSYYKGGN